MAIFHSKLLVNEGNTSNFDPCASVMVFYIHPLLEKNGPSFPVFFWLIHWGIQWSGYNRCSQMGRSQHLKNSPWFYPVGGFNPSEKYMKVSWGYYSQCMNNKNIPNHQPANIWKNHHGLWIANIWNIGWTIHQHPASHVRWWPHWRWWSYPTRLKRPPLGDGFYHDFTMFTW